jgi:hypothetical protein
MLANDDLPEAPERWYCSECGKVSEHYLTGLHPFLEGQDISGCPNCRNVETLVVACYHPGCPNKATGGYPRGHGFRYVWTCFEHRPGATSAT